MTDGVHLCAESSLALYLVRRLSHFLAICSEVSLPSRPRPFKMVLMNTHRSTEGGDPHSGLFQTLQMGDVPPSYLGRISFPSEQRLVGCPELDQPFHILFSHWQLRGGGQRSETTAAQELVFIFHLLTFIVVFWELRQWIKVRLHRLHH